MKHLFFIILLWLPALMATAQAGYDVTAGRAARSFEWKEWNSAAAMYEQTGCDFVMVGRGALGNPWIFSQINSYLENPEKPLHYPSLEERLDVMTGHIEKMVEYKGEHMALLQARKLVAGYFKGMRGAATLRNEAGRISTLEDLYVLKEKALSANF